MKDTITIIKRDGRKVSYQPEKIYNAVHKACKATGLDEHESEHIAKSVRARTEKEIELISENGHVPVTVEQIQDIVVGKLISMRNVSVSTAYIKYREKRERERQRKTALQKTIEEITFAGSKDSDIKRDNGNVDGDSPMGMMLQYGSAVTKDFTDNNLLSDKVRDAVVDGDIYIHDKDFYPMGTLTCLQIPLDKLFEKGFNTGHGTVRTPQTIGTYASLAAVAIQANQNDMHGGQAIPLFDYYMAPGVTKSFAKNFRRMIATLLSFGDMEQLSDDNINKSLDESILSFLPLSAYEQKHKADTIGRMSRWMEDQPGFSSLADQLEPIWDKAWKQTDKDTYQAMEGFIHNMNTLHCLPYDEELWVYDDKEKYIEPMAIGQLYEKFEPNRYHAMSLNKTEMTSELKPIIAIEKKDNHRRLITIETRYGRHVTTTDNHRILTMDEDCELSEGYPEQIENVVTMKFGGISKDEVTRAIPSDSKDTYVYDLSVKDNENFMTKEGIFVHNSRAGAQVPFSSVNFGMDTSAEGRMVTKNLLLAQEAGLGKGETPIFPILIFQVKEGVNYNPEDINYDLFQLSIRVSAKRLFPNFVFVDAPFNKKYYNPEDKESIIATMGCVDGKETIDLMIIRKECTKQHGELGSETMSYTSIKNYEKITFENAWDYFAKRCPVMTHGDSEYIDLKGYKDEDVFVSDSRIGYTEVHKLIRNPDKGDWVCVKAGKYQLICTKDHPLPIIPELAYEKGRIKTKRTSAEDIQKEDRLVITDEVDKRGMDIHFVYVPVEEIESLGYRKRHSYDVETTSDCFDVSGILSHNCRTRVIGNVNGKETPVGRGNLSFTSINLPRLGIKHGILYRKENGLSAHGQLPFDYAGFMDDLDQLIDLCIQQLLERYQVQKHKYVKNFPFLMGQHLWRGTDKLNSNDELDDAINNGSLTVGFIGLAECLVALTGHHHGEARDNYKDDYPKDYDENYKSKWLDEPLICSNHVQCEDLNDVVSLAYAIIYHMREKMEDAAKEYNLNFGLLATPAEGLSGRFTKIDQKKYGHIEGVTDRAYYTNSFHVPVYQPIRYMDKIHIEAPYHGLTNGGHITYVEVDGDLNDNLEAFEAIVRCMKESGVGYGSINHPVDRDPVCGYSGVIKGNICPNCGRDISKHTHIKKTIKLNKK